MDLSNILSIAGKPGLYKVVSQSRGGVVVTSLQDGRKMSIGQTQRVSSLSDISIYTEEGDEPLADIFTTMFKNSDGKAIDVNMKDNSDLRNYFLEILPDHDEERVYASDIKKMIKWFNLLLEKGELSIEESAEESKEEATEAPEEE